MGEQNNKDLFEKRRAKAEKVYLLPTKKFLTELADQTVFKIISPYPTIHNVDCYLKLDVSGEVLFRVPQMSRESKIPPVEFQHIGYGLHKPFMLVGNSRAYWLPHGVGTLQMSFSSEMFKGNISEIESKSQNPSFFFRSLIPMDQSVAVLAGYFQTLSFSTESSFRAAGLMNIKINNIRFRIFDYEIEGQHYLIVDSLDLIAYEDFLKIVKSFLAVIGVIGGCFYRERVITLTSTDADMSGFHSFSLIKMDKSKHGLEAVRPRDMIDFFPGLKKKSERYLLPAIFEKLVTLCLDDARFSRAVNIVAESHGYPLEIRASTYSVALETLKNIIIQANEEKINPIKTKAAARTLVGKLKEVVNDFGESEFNNKNLIIQKLEHLNQIGNTDSFSRIFELLNMELTLEDIMVLNKRNDFLHGRIPFEDEEHTTKEKELRLVTLKLHFLICSLILKMGGYNGYLINNVRLSFKEMADEPVYRNISKDADRDQYVP